MLNDRNKTNSLEKTEDIEREGLATTTMLRGLMQRELFKKTKQQRESLEKTTNNHSKLADDSSNTYTQSDIHFQAIMGDKFKEYNTPEKKVDAFDLIYTQLSVVMNDGQRQQFAKMLNQEKFHKNVVYTGSSADISFLNDLVTEFRSQLEHQYEEDFQFLRAIDEVFAYSNFNNITEFMTANDFDRSKHYKYYALSVNPFVFGSDGKKYEATFRYFLENDINEQQDIKKLFEPFAKRLQIDVDFSIFEEIFEKYVKQTGGVCYQIFIDESCIDQLVKPAAENGRPNPLQTEKGELNDFSAVIKELQTNPTKYSDYIRNMQARLFLNPKYSDKIKIKTYHANPLSTEEDKKYRNALRDEVSKFIKQLLINYKTLPSAAFISAKGKPSLHHQMGIVYQNNNLPNIEKSDLRILIPALIAEDKIHELVNVIVNTEDIDLYIAIYNLDGVRAPSLLDFFEKNVAVSAAVFNELQQHQNKDHVGKALQHLFSSALKHYVCIGNISKIKDFFKNDLKRNSIYLNESEIWLEEKKPNIYRDCLIDELLLLAAEHNQIEVFAWLLKKFQDYGYESKDLSPSRRKNSLTIAIEKGHHEIVEQILAVIKIEKMTDIDFNDFLLLARKHNHPEVIAAILKKLKTAPKEIAEKVLFQKNSIVFYLANNKHEEILKIIGITANEVKTDVRVLIPELLAGGDVSRLLEIMINTKNLDLSNLLIVPYDYGKIPKSDSKRSILSFFSDHLAMSEKIYAALLPNNKEEHIAKAMQQLQPYAWYQYVSVGNLEKSKELFPINYPDQKKHLEKALYLAANFNQEHVFAWLLKRCQEPDSNYECRKLFETYTGSSLRVAIKKGHNSIVKQILSFDKTNPTIQNYREILLLAATNDKFEIIEMILEKLKTEPEEVIKEVLIRKNEYSFLCDIVAKGHDFLLKNLLKAQPWLRTMLNEVSSQNYEKLLMIAIRNHHANIVNTLLEHSSDANELINDAITSRTHPLIFATKYNDVSTIKLLLKNINSLIEMDQYGKTAIMVAAELNYTEALVLLLNNSKVHASLSYLTKKTSIDNLDALSLAAKKGNIEAVRILLTKPQLDSNDSSQQSQYKFALWNLEKFPAAIWDFKSALQQAAKFRHTEVFKIIASNESCPIDIALDAATEADNIEAIKTILQRIKTVEDFNNLTRDFDQEKNIKITKIYKHSASKNEIINDTYSLLTSKSTFWSNDSSSSLKQLETHNETKEELNITSTHEDSEKQLNLNQLGYKDNH